MYCHGGEIYGKEVALDFSVNINPFGMPEEIRAALLDPANLALYESYPDGECRDLRALLAASTGVPAERVVCGTGASELLDASVRAFGRGGGMLLSPCFTEYALSFAKEELPIVWCDRRREDGFALPESFLRTMEREKPSLTILCNPGNPMGELLPEEFIRGALRGAASYGGSVLVDECFMDFCTDEDQKRCSAAGLLDTYPNLLLLKAFTKTYAMAGLRLGFLLTGGSRQAESVKRRLPAWNVSAPAQLAGVLALGLDGEYLRKTARYLVREKKRVSDRLKELGYTVYPGAADFLFFEADTGLYDRLLSEKLLIRQCGNYRGLGPGYYRMAVKAPEENDRLLGLMGGKR